MIADRTAPDDSTPRRGFGWARSLLRAVKGAVEATRQAAKTFAEQVEIERLTIEVNAERKRLQREAQRRVRARGATARTRPIIPLEDRLPFMPLEIRQLFMAVMGQGWAAMRPKLSQLQKIRRYYLGRAAEPFVPFRVEEVAKGLVPIPRLRAERHENWARILEQDAFDRHRPKPSLPGPAIPCRMPAFTRSAAAVAGRLMPVPAPLRPS